MEKIISDTVLIYFSEFLRILFLFFSDSQGFFQDSDRIFHIFTDSFRILSGFFLVTFLTSAEVTFVALSSFKYNFG